MLPQSWKKDFFTANGKINKVKQLTGAFNFRKWIIGTLQLSTYYEGCSLFEDADCSVRVVTIRLLYLNTTTNVNHFHDASGRTIKNPNPITNCKTEAACHNIAFNCCPI